MLVYDNQLTTNGKDVFADHEHRWAALSGHLQPSGATAADIMLELDEAGEDTSLTHPLLRAELDGLTVRRLRPGDALAWPIPTIPWLIIIDDPLPPETELFGFDDCTLANLFRNAHQILVNSIPPYVGLYDPMIEKALQGQQILLVQTRRLEMWVHGIQQIFSGEMRGRRVVSVTLSDRNRA